MATLSRRWTGPTLVLAALVCAGCDMGALTYFLMPEPKVDPECKTLASPDKKKEVKVAILAFAPGLDLDLMQSDRQLCELLGKHLRDQYERNGDKVTIVPQGKVEDFKSSNPDLHPRDVGKHFHADYVIVLEIHSLGIYEKGNTMYRGRADLTVTAVDMHKPDEAPERKEYNTVYPGESRGAMDICPELPPLQFRLKFLDNIARKLTRYFAAYSTREAYDVD